MAARLTDRQRKKIVADYVQYGSYSAAAKLNGVSTESVRRVIKSCEEITDLVRRKKEENTADILAYMESQRATVCEIINNGLEELRKPEKMESASPNQITTALGTLIDKWAMINGGTSDSDKVRVIIDV